MLYFYGPMFTITFTFAKRGQMKFISHLDLMRLLTRALRRAGLPIKLTQGFNPHPKLSMMRALKLGLESDHEEARVALRAFVNPQDFRTRFQSQLPEGITIKEAYYGKRDISQH